MIAGAKKLIWKGKKLTYEYRSIAFVGADGLGLVVREVSADCSIRQGATNDSR